MKKSEIDLTKMIRPGVSNFMPYIGGKPVETIKRELGLQNVIKLASNENPLGPSKAAIKAMEKVLSKAYFYPDSNSWELKQAIAKKFGLKDDNVILGCGSDEIIELLAKAFLNPGDEIVVSEHAFIRYKMAGDLMQAKVVSVPMDGLKHNLKLMAQAVTPKTKAIFIANPNNPTGTYNTKKELEQLLDSIAIRPDGTAPLVVIDEAYYEYAKDLNDYPQTIGYLNDYKNLVILRTFSKVYGLAGVRVGYGFSSCEIVGYIERIRPPFNINAVAQEGALASLGDDKQVKKSIELVNAQKKYVYNELNKMKLVFIPSAANFVLINVKPFSGLEAFNKLLKMGVIVRAMDEYDLKDYIRVSIGLVDENKLFIKALKKLFKPD
jgi:histidinol-phosphate aminotransferase